MDAERERQLRRRFGPQPRNQPAAEPEQPPRRRLPPGAGVAAVVAAVLAVTLATFYLVTPHEHVAPGCFWWTAARVGDVVPGGRGCLRGYVAMGGWLAEGRSRTDPALPFSYADPDQLPGRSPCPFDPGDAVVVRYHAVFDDGATIVVIEDCR